MNRGQYFRLFLGTTANPTTPIAAAKQMALHGSAQTEESSTKDTTGDALEYEVTGLSYEITGGALAITVNDTLMTGANGIANIESWIKDQLLYWRICLCEGTKNRTIVEEICSGTGKLTSLQIQAPNRQKTTYNYTLTGYGPINFSGYTPSSSDI